MTFTDPITNIIHFGKSLCSKDVYEIIECTTCSFKHVAPFPSEKQLNKLYAEEFYSHAKPNYFKHVEEDLDWWNMHYEIRLRIFEKYVSAKRILEIGSGPGYFLKKAKKCGWDALGFEPSKLACDYSRKHGARVVNDFFSAHRASQYGLFDVIYTELVLEHIPRPLHIIKDAYTLLKPQGIICVISPNDFNPLQKIIVQSEIADFWWVSPLQHINYFDFRSMAKALESAGFAVRDAYGTFPMEFFLLTGDNYVGNDALGRACHAKRKKFEHYVYCAEKEKLYAWFKQLANNHLGREFIIIGQKK